MQLLQNISICQLWKLQKEQQKPAKLTRQGRMLQYHIHRKLTLWFHFFVSPGLNIYFPFLRELDHFHSLKLNDIHNQLRHGNNYSPVICGLISAIAMTSSRQCFTNIPINRKTTKCSTPLNSRSTYMIQPASPDMKNRNSRPKYNNLNIA